MTTQHELAATEMWQAHSEDESEAIQAQQDAAGATHRPVEGPPPYGSEELNLLARDIVARERERCARFVESSPHGLGEAVTGLLRAIAAGLREAGVGALPGDRPGSSARAPAAEVPAAGG